MRLSTRHFLIGGILLSVLILFYVKTNHIVFSEHQRFDGCLDRLRELDASINQDVLKARAQLLEDYDSFPDQINEMRRIVGGGASVPSFVSQNGRREIQKDLKGFSETLDQKEELLERFKSQNALLKNSLQYLPLAGTELIKQMPTDEEGRNLEALLNELMRQVLAYSLNPSEDQTTEIQLSLRKLSEWRERHDDVPQDAALASLAAHSNSIVNHKPRVEELTRQLITVPTGARIETIHGLYDSEFSKALQAADSYRAGLYLLCGMLILSIGYTIYALDTANIRLEHRVAERTGDLVRKNNELEMEIAERLRIEVEMERINKKLMDVSRRAGMAEVATSVLHNVGNVLNSVNVSCSVIGETVRKSRIRNVGKVAALFHEHASDMAGFLLHDPTGQKLPGFLAKLSDRLGEEQASVLDELQSLNRNVGHIRDIVAMQQSYGNVGGIQETVPIKELVEDALQMSGAALTRHGVEVVREYETVPPVSVDKHKVLQILVNLIRNAKHALADGGSRHKRLTVRVASDARQIKVSVNDNGIGISPENLTRIFAHGFTTKKDGHGFGLHSGVLAAQDMGGRLTARSDGLGAGATFDLELPLGAGRSTLL